MKNIWNGIREIVESDTTFLLLIFVTAPLVWSHILMSYRFNELRSTVIDVNQCYMNYVTAKTQTKLELAKCINGVQQ